MKKLISITTQLLLIVLLASCNSFTQGSNSPTPIPISSILIDNGSGIVPSPTPFQPILPTSTKTHSGSAEASPKLTATLAATNPTPTTNAIAQSAGQVNILIFGSDYRPNQGFRTDVILLLSLNPSKGTATLTSFPRDLYISIPGIGMERINTAQEYGGFALTQATFQQNFGFTPDYYVMTNFNGFTSIINTLGGIDVTVSLPLTDKCKFSSLENSAGYCTIPTGVYHMDADLALWYVRSRYTTSDFDRTRRAQEVITAIFQKIVSLDGLNRAAELYGSFSSSVETSLPLTEIVSLIPLASQLATNTSAIRRYAIGPSETSNYVVPGSGAMVLVPNMDAVKAIILQALN